MERAYKVSLNRPYATRDYRAVNMPFNAEYPMIRWLEANGYDVAYTTGLDGDRRGALIRNHKVFLSVGHDEYRRPQARRGGGARARRGVHLAFFSGNEIFWKTRWESSIAGTVTTYRTLVCYKETHSSPPEKIDPSPEWTGTWRDPVRRPRGGRPRTPSPALSSPSTRGVTIPIVLRSSGRFASGVTPRSRG
jgi:hypothetical protein